MNLRTAQRIPDELVEKLRPGCSRIEVAGSIRRRKPFCRDIDIVLIAGNQGKLLMAFRDLGLKGGPKMVRGVYKGVKVDIYIATPETWATLLLIRTGSRNHNIRLCRRAHDKGLLLHADGRGLVKPGDGCCSYADTPDTPILCATEGDIFEALGLPYRRPEERE